MHIGGYPSLAGPTLFRNVPKSYGALAEEAVTLAKQMIARDPNHVYAHYVVSLCGDMAEGLQAATQGLQCPQVTPFLRKQLLWRAVESGAWQGLEHIMTADEEDEEEQDKGAALLHAAWCNAKTFLTEAAPDAHLRLVMLGWTLLLTFVLRGPELSDDLNEIESIRSDIDTATAVMTFFGHAAEALSN
ncbi:hypothetical protein C8T65DRAFT_694658 [Cerioporus squamosus]|nr:hypothetical protein C8T65DRAFT_694658 [Cerioporus squamosus]